jgi:hypothetical protein
VCRYGDIIDIARKRRVMHLISSAHIPVVVSIREQSGAQARLLRRIIKDIKQDRKALLAARQVTPSDAASDATINLSKLQHSLDHLRAESASIASGLPEAIDTLLRDAVDAAAQV